MSAKLLCVVASLSLTAAAHATQVLGPWLIESAPTSATLVSGGGSLWNWLNVSNTPLTLNQALTNFPLADTGYADAVAGTIVDLTYAPGQAYNGPGLDLVLLDARYSQNDYTLYSSTDGFTTPLVIPAASLVWNGDTRNFYVGSLNNNQTYPAQIMTYGIDLSFWGIPAGGDVTTIRMVLSGFECDPLGIGVLQPAVPAPGAAALLGMSTLLTLRRRR